MLLPIAMIPYANMAPFQEMGPPAGCAFIQCTPRDSVAALKQKQVWAAAVPVGGLAMLQDQVDFLGTYGIAARSEAMSVLFFSDRPFAEFRHPLALRLTEESASSVRLLYLLLGYGHGFEHMPFQAVQPGPVNGELVIGDAALVRARIMAERGAVEGFWHVMDLAVEWYSRHQLPFVFARWVIHREAPPDLRDILSAWLGRFQQQEQDLIRKAAPKVAARLQLPLDYVERYLKVIRRCLTGEDEAGQARFLSELKQHAQEPLFPKAGEREDI